MRAPTINLTLGPFQGEYLMNEVTLKNKSHGHNFLLNCLSISASTLSTLHTVQDTVDTSTFFEKDFIREVFLKLRHIFECELAAQY